MTFLNAVLLGGVAAAAVPILIHIINRNRFRIVPWGAMRLLEDAVRVRRRRLRIEQILLLLVRAAIPLFLALCMARPVLTGVEALLGRAKTSMAVLVDNSCSMNAPGKSGSCLARAREEAGRILETLPRGSEATVVWMAGAPGTPSGPTFDLARLRSALTGTALGFGMADPAAALETAAGILSRSHNAARELVVVSDFQRVNWTDENASSTAQGRPPAPLATGLDLLNHLAIPPSIVLLRVGRETTDNVAVESLDLSRAIVGANQSLRVRANIRNFGESAYPDLRVYFRVDGQERSASQIALAPRETAQVLFSHEFDKPGSHVIEVQSAADALEADNIRRMSVPVWDRLPILLVSADTDPAPLRGETAYLEIALQPFKAARGSLADLIQTRTISAGQFQPRTLSDARVVVLANARQLSGYQLKALEDFVREGGGLLIFPGDRANSQWYNGQFWNGGGGLLPCQLADLSGSVKEETGANGNAPAAGPAAIVARHYDHPALEVFNDPRSGSLGDGKIRFWYKLKPPETAEGKTVVLARLDTGDPFLVEKEFGAGRVIQCCSSCDADWSSLPMQPSYLPLMQQLATYLASKASPSRNVEVGQRLVAFLPLEDAGKTATLTDPEGQEHELTVEARANHGLVEYDKTGRPGLYVITPPGPNPSGGGQAGMIHFVANTSPKESDLRTLDKSELVAMAKQMKADLVSSGEEYARLDQRRRFGREIWKGLLWTVLGLLFSELLLEQRLSRVRE